MTILKNLNASLRLLAICSFTLFFAPAVYAQVQAVPSDDTNVDQSPRGASGTVERLRVGGPAKSTTFVRFDLSSLPAGVTGAGIEKATLKVYVAEVVRGGSFEIRRVQGAWAEATLAAGPASSILGNSIGAPVAVTTANRGDYLLVDVTQLARDWVDGVAANDGVAFVAVGDTFLQFDSKENRVTSHEAALEVVFATGGQQGPQGEAGPAGPRGADGPAGPRGAQGEAGPVGPQGAAGPQGGAGPAGPQGEQGPAGARGLTWKGTWQAAASYAVDDAVSYLGSSWIARQASTGSVPVEGATWTALASKGDAGAQGPQGLTGAQGPVGAQGSQGVQGEIGPVGPQGATGLTGPQGTQGGVGPQGEQGAAGAKGLTWKGAWSSDTNYVVDDAVSYLGSSWIARQVNTGSAPVEGAAWTALASKGDTGAQGPQGETGAEGPVGAQGSQGPQGAAGPVGPQGAAGPQGGAGPAGPQGEQGPAGARGLTWKGAWSSDANYAVDDAVSYLGSSWIARQASTGSVPVEGATWTALASKGDAGAQGPQGLTGAQGPAGVEGPQGVQGATGSAGPQGATGAAGPQGAEGPAGPAGPQGATGPQGPQGEQGPAGVAGGVELMPSDSQTAAQVGSGALVDVKLLGTQNLGSSGSGDLLSLKASGVYNFYTGATPDARDQERFRVDNSGGFAAFGETDLGSIPAEGAGARFMWLGYKGATRAGYVDGTQWDDANIGYYSTAFGYNARGSGDYAFAAGRNTVAANIDSVALGNYCTASGAASVALGYYAHTNTRQGSFVFSDRSVVDDGNFATDESFKAAVNHSFNVRATGGLWFFTNTATNTGLRLSHLLPSNTAYGSFVWTDRSSDTGITPTAQNQTIFRSSGGYWLYSDSYLSAGVTLAPGAGAWTTVSDRNMKENFLAVDGEEVLRRLQGVPVTTWNYKAQGPKVRHLGPMAQDFFAAFGLDLTDKGINTVDIDGVVLAGVKALDARTEGQQARIEALEADVNAKQTRIEELERRLERLERLLGPATDAAHPDAP